MAVWNNLPNELLHKIAQCSSISTADLARLARVNRVLHDVVLPLLYQEIRFRSFDQIDVKRPRVQPFASFVLTTLLNRRIAALVQSLYLVPGIQKFGRDGPAWRQRIASRHGEHDTVRDVIEDRLEELFTSEKLQVKWSRQIHGGQMSTIIAFALSLLPNLRALRIKFQYRDLESTFAQIVSCRRRKPELGPQFFARLEYLCFEAPYGTWALRDMPGVIRNLPALQYLRMSLAEDSIEQCFKHVSLSGLRYASFRDPFCLSESRLREFVQNCGQLNHLEFEMRSCWSISKYTLMGSTFIGLLSQHCPNLKVLSILDRPCCASGEPECFNEVMDRRSQARDLAALDLRPLQSLQKLHIGIAFIHDKIEGNCLATFQEEYDDISAETNAATLSELLPLSMQEIVLTGCDMTHDYYLNQSVVALLRHKDIRHPNLASVSFTYRNSPNEADTSRVSHRHSYQGVGAGGRAFEEARTLAKEVGVSFGQPFELWGYDWGKNHGLLRVVKDLRNLSGS